MSTAPRTRDAAWRLTWRKMIGPCGTTTAPPLPMIRPISPPATHARRRRIRLRTLEAAVDTLYVTGPILALPIGLMHLPSAKRPLVPRFGRASGMMAPPMPKDQACGTFTRAVAAAT